MTGILPIKKYGTHSALNMFREYSMLNADPFTEFMGFTEQEVYELCDKYNRDFIQCKMWYDGYQIKDFKSIYNPRSVRAYIDSGNLDSYWNKTETYEALSVYMTMKDYGVCDTISNLIANDSIRINTGKFKNDMVSFNSKDDVLTLLVHLGYLTYDAKSSTVSIPNKEITMEFVNTIDEYDWPILFNAIKNSENLLSAVLKKDCAAVAEGIASAHFETSILQYNDENALACTISLALYAAREFYTIVREFPTGKGFADLVFFPRPKCIYPLLLVELKWNKSVKAAVSQIYDRNYPQSLKDFRGDILIVAVNYDKDTKEHTCSIESYKL